MAMFNLSQSLKRPEKKARSCAMKRVVDLRRVQSNGPMKKVVQSSPTTMSPTRRMVKACTNQSDREKVKANLHQGHSGTTSASRSGSGTWVAMDFIARFVRGTRLWKALLNHIWELPKWACKRKAEDRGVNVVVHDMRADKAVFELKLKRRRLTVPTISEQRREASREANRGMVQARKLRLMGEIGPPHKSPLDGYLFSFRYRLNLTEPFVGKKVATKVDEVSHQDVTKQTATHVNNPTSKNGGMVATPMAVEFTPVHTPKSNQFVVPSQVPKSNKGIVQPPAQVPQAPQIAIEKTRMTNYSTQPPEQEISTLVKGMSISSMNTPQQAQSSKLALAQPYTTATSNGWKPTEKIAGRAVTANITSPESTMMRGDMDVSAQKKPQQVVPTKSKASHNPSNVIPILTSSPAVAPQMPRAEPRLIINQTSQDLRSLESRMANLSTEAEPANSASTTHQHPSTSADESSSLPAATPQIPHVQPGTVVDRTSKDLTSLESRMANLSTAPNTTPAERDSDFDQSSKKSAALESTMANLNIAPKTTQAEPSSVVGQSSKKSETLGTMMENFRNASRNTHAQPSSVISQTPQSSTILDVMMENLSTTDGSDSTNTNTITPVEVTPQEVAWPEVQWSSMSAKHLSPLDKKLYDLYQNRHIFGEQAAFVADMVSGAKGKNYSTPLPDRDRNSIGDNCYESVTVAIHRGAPRGKVSRKELLSGDMDVAEDVAEFLNKELQEKKPEHTEICRDSFLAVLLHQGFIDPTELVAKEELKAILLGEDGWVVNNKHLDDLYMREHFGPKQEEVLGRLFFRQAMDLWCEMRIENLLWELPTKASITGFQAFFEQWCDRVANHQDDDSEYTRAVNNARLKQRFSRIMTQAGFCRKNTHAGIRHLFEDQTYAMLIYDKVSDSAKASALIDTFEKVFEWRYPRSAIFNSFEGGRAFEKGD